MKSACELANVAQLAAEHPDLVSLQTWGRTEGLAEFRYAVYSSGDREVRTLPARLVPAAYVARVANGLSFGRHCCAIGPDNKALRETAFNCDGEVLRNERPMSRYRLQYWRKRWEGDVTSRPWLPPKQRIEGRVALLNTRYSHNFYHWMIDILPRLAPLRELRGDIDYYLVDCLTPFRESVLETLGIRRQQLIQPHCRLLLEAEELLVPSLPTPACLRDLGRTLLSGFGGERRLASARKLYITRRKTGTRGIANESELERILSSYGFETRAMEEHSLLDQARFVREADVVVAPHGAGLANLIFARPGTRVIEIVPDGRSNAPLYPELSRIFGLHHQQLSAERLGRRTGMKVVLNDLDAALAMAERLGARAAAA
jgi:hypothetical protein